MAFNDSFGSFGHYAFSSKPTHGRSIYESMCDGMGDAYNKDFTAGIQQARLYAQAMCLASAQYQLDRALNNRNPLKATELLGKLEDDYQVTPGPNATLDQRRRFLAALFKVSRGNSQGVIESALTTLLGTGFVSYTHGSPITFPALTAGTFDKSAAKIKRFYILSPVSVIGVPVTLPILVDSISESPIIGEQYSVDPNPYHATERITIANVFGASAITATFAYSHEPNTIATRPFPVLASLRRSSVIKVTLAVAQDPEKRRQINELMAKAVRGVSTWSIVCNSGVFTSDDPVLGLPDIVPVS